MKLTREEAIENHRKMWNWIADETEKRKRKVEKIEYFDEHMLDLDFCFLHCYCCQYVYGDDGDYAVLFTKCDLCPIEWGVKMKNCIFDEYCLNGDSPFLKFVDTCSGDYKTAAKYAREIANLPERKIK